MEPHSLALLVGLVLGVGSAGSALITRGRWLRARIKETVTVHLTDGTTIEGVLVDHSRQGLVLSFAKYLDEEVSVPMAGETLIPQEKVLLVQVARRAS